jgi:outer membrane protein assembly factor BamB
LSGAAKTLLAGLWAQAEYFWHDRRHIAIGLIVASVVVVAGAGVLTYELVKRPGDVHNPNATFVPQEPARAKAKTVNWPMFGLNPARTRYLPAKGVKPPFRKLWRFTEKPLLEFPPIYVGGKLYFVDNNGTARALDADTGKILWERSIGRLNASSPAYYKHRLYIVNLVPGHIVKLDAKTGKTIWKRSLPGRAESSPVVVDRTVYFGCEDGNLYALSTGKGNVRWSTSLNGPVKSAPAYYRGTLYVGDYGGSMNAVDAKTGRIRWQTASLGSGFGTSGAFYSTPAVAFGRVYAGNNDNRVYSFDRKDGTLAWSYSTGGYAYSGPTVSTTRHAPPTVYIGSFDGNVYALDAKDGSLRWSRSAGGQVVGSLSAIGDIVYVAEFTHNSTSGLMMRSGKRVFRYRRGTYSPVISDGRRIYLTGYSSLTALEPYKLKGEVAPAIVAPKASPRSRPEEAAGRPADSARKQGKPGDGGRR